MRSPAPSARVLRMAVAPVADSLTYQPRLDRLQEGVISAHFMHQVCTDARLEAYGHDELAQRTVVLSVGALRDQLLPTLRRASTAFARERATAAKLRAAKRHAGYGLDDPRKVGPAAWITEVMFDRQFRRGPRETYSRQVLHQQVAQRIAAGATIEMAIPALPYKFSCPLKTRGQLPDLSEVNFLLGLFEIAAAIELLYREAQPARTGILARFTVVSDGRRFNQLVSEPDAVIEAYRRGLDDWRRRLELEDYVELRDYPTVLREGLSEADQDAKRALRDHGLRQYAEVMWPLFDADDMRASLAAAAAIDPDPEQVNAEGRFVSLLKSLVFIVRYPSLEPFRALPSDAYRALYRELTGHLFTPFAADADERDAGAAWPVTRARKEQLRRTMLREVWAATIAYIAEIKSDRELAREPICTCLPDHLRWTIHTKPGQLGLLTPSGLGMQVQAWAGAAVFKRARDGGIRLCTAPVLALEGAGAIPVCTDDAPGGQPVFYIHPDVGFGGIDDFVAGLARQLVRRRSS